MLATSFEPHFHNEVEFKPSFENFSLSAPMDRAAEIYLGDLYKWADANPNENRHLEIHGLLKAFEENAVTYQFHNLMISELPPLPQPVQFLSIANCPNLASLGVHDLSNIIELFISRCPTLSTLSDSLYNLTKLQLDRCNGFIYLLNYFPKLVGFIIYKCTNLVQIPAFFPDSLIYVSIYKSLQISSIPNCFLKRFEKIDLHTDIAYLISTLEFMRGLEQWRCRGQAINENRDMIAAYIKHIYITHATLVVLTGWTISELPPIPWCVNQLVVKQCPNIIDIPYDLMARVELLSDNPILHHHLNQSVQIAMMHEDAAQNPALQQILFEKNLITILQMYSSVINALLTTSLTLDIVNHAPPEITAPHFTLWQQVNGGRLFYDAESLKLALENSFGDCDQRSCICKSMIDMYLADTLTKLGYHNVSIKSNVLAARPPGRHYVVSAVCAWNGMPPKLFMIDPWSNAAWRFMTGLAHLRSRTPDLYTHPDLEFEFAYSVDRYLEDPANQTALHQNFVNHKIKEKLDEIVQMGEPYFLGLPVNAHQ